MPYAVRCYDCNSQVVNLKAHRPECPNRKYGSRLIKCYDCGEKVKHISSHRSTCTNSRKANSKISLPTEESVNSNELIESYTTMFMLIDVSGSMNGSPLENAKTAVTSCFSNMHDRDRFSIVTFDSSAFFKLKPRPVEQLRRQEEIPLILSKIFSGGCTALYDAIYISVEQIHNKRAPNAIVVLTDGLDNSSHHTLQDVKTLLSEYPAVHLDIIHVDEDGAKVPDYEDLCATRGTYSVIKTEEIVEVTTTVYRRTYSSFHPK